jgi:hypothetical protein
MKELIFKQSSLTFQGKHLNAIIYNKNVVSQAQNFKKPKKTTNLKNNQTQKKTPGWVKKKKVFPTCILVIRPTLSYVSEHASARYGLVGAPGYTQLMYDQDSHLNLFTILGGDVDPPHTLNQEHATVSF